MDRGCGPPAPTYGSIYPVNFLHRSVPAVVTDRKGGDGVDAGGLERLLVAGLVKGLANPGNSWRGVKIEMDLTKAQMVHVDSLSNDGTAVDGNAAG